MIDSSAATRVPFRRLECKLILLLVAAVLGPARVVDQSATRLLSRFTRRIASRFLTPSTPASSFLLRRDCPTSTAHLFNIVCYPDTGLCPTHPKTRTLRRRETQTTMQQQGRTACILATWKADLDTKPFKTQSFAKPKLIFLLRPYSGVHVSERQHYACVPGEDSPHPTRLPSNLACYLLRTRIHALCRRLHGGRDVALNGSIVNRYPHAHVIEITCRTFTVVCHANEHPFPPFVLFTTRTRSSVVSIGISTSKRSATHIVMPFGLRQH